MERFDIIKSFIVLLGIIGIIGILIIAFLSLLSNSPISSKSYSDSSSDTVLTNNGTTITLSQTPITSPTVTANNQTWLEFDGVNDFAYIDYNHTISLWFKNETTDWTNLINSSGSNYNIYLNGIINTTNPYFPFYYNSSNWILGKSNATTFEKVYIDNIRLYNEWINETDATEVYNLGR